MRNHRGRLSVTQKVQAALKVESRKEVFALLAQKLGQVSSIKETVAKLAETTGVKATPVAVRKMLRQGIKSGLVRKGTPLFAVARISRGRPLGYSPIKAAEASA